MILLSEYLTITIMIPYIANCSRWKTFTVCRIELYVMCWKTFAVEHWSCIAKFHRLFYWKSFAIADQATKTVKLSDHEQFAKYGSQNLLLL